MLAEEVCCKDKFLAWLVLFLTSSRCQIVEMFLVVVSCPFDQVKLEVCPGEGARNCEVVSSARPDGVQQAKRHVWK